MSGTTAPGSPLPARATGGLLAGASLVAAGGGFVLLGGAFFLGVGLYLAPTHPGLANPWVLLFLVPEAVLGVVLVVLARLIALRPQRHRLWGGLAVPCGVASLFFPPAGLFLGPILTVIGGIVAIASKPPEPFRWPASAPAPLGLAMSGAPPPPSPTRICPACGRPNPPAAVRCFQCGARLG